MSKRSNYPRSGEYTKLMRARPAVESGVVAVSSNRLRRGGHLKCFVEQTMRQMGRRASVQGKMVWAGKKRALELERIVAASH